MIDDFVREITDLTCENSSLKYELEELNKQLEKCYCNRTDCTGRVKDSKKYDSLVQKVDNQQKEFIKYLENQSKLYKEDMNKINAIENPYKWDEWKDIAHEYEVILRKYKEIIGDDEK